MWVNIKMNTKSQKLVS